MMGYRSLKYGRFLRGGALGASVLWGGVCAQTHLALETRAVRALTEVMIRDITSPPVAARDYAYTLIAFYEAARPADSSFKSYGGLLSGLGPLPRPVPGLDYDWLIAGLAAFHKTAYALIFSKDLFERYWDSVTIVLRGRAGGHGAARAGRAAVFQRSVAFGEAVAAAVLAWSRTDKYAYTRTLPRFTPTRDAGAWQPTAPEYMDAIEPYWNQIRPMVLRVPGQFPIPPPSPFGSAAFLQEASESYQIGLRLTPSQMAVADFWDCNPFAVQTVGHLIFSVKKVSPGGHWIAITGVACLKAHLRLVASLRAYSLVSIAIFDAIIACWDEKYRTNYIRPITVVQQSVSATWQPRLQTPPFPEYPSGHSCISGAAATVLTHLFGASFAFSDDTERPYGLPARSFPSFLSACDEAAISRLYGGIHFREAVVNGKAMGCSIGAFVISSLE